MTYKIDETQPTCPLWQKLVLAGIAFTLGVYIGMTLIANGVLG